MKNQYWFRKGAGVRVCFFAVVVNAKLRQFPNQSDQVETTPVIPFTNLDLGNVVSTPLNSGAHACNVELRCIEANIPNPNLNSRLQRSLQQNWDCVAPTLSRRCWSKAWRLPTGERGARQGESGGTSTPEGEAQYSCLLSQATGIKHG
jgi:hypothetical protein